MRESIFRMLCGFFSQKLNGDDNESDCPDFLMESSFLQIIQGEEVSCCHDPFIPGEMLQISCNENRLIFSQQGIQKRTALFIGQLHIRECRLDHSGLFPDFIEEHGYAFLWESELLSSENFSILAEDPICDDRDDAAIKKHHEQPDCCRILMA